MTVDEYQKKIFDTLTPIWEEANKKNENLEFWEGLIKAKVNGLDLVKIGYEKQRKKK